MTMKENCGTRALDVGLIKPATGRRHTTPTLTGDVQAEAIDTVFTAAEMMSRIKRLQDAACVVNCPLNIALHVP